MSWLKKILSTRSTPLKIVWWVGTDAWKLVMMPPLSLLMRFRIISSRIFWKIAHKKFNEHWINHIELKSALMEFGIPEHKIKLHETPYSKKKYRKKDTDKFWVLFYINRESDRQDYTDWVFGKRYLDELQKNYDIFLIEGKHDMAEVFPIVAVYIKINKTKYSGLNRIGKQCKINNIPVYTVNDFADTFENNLKRLEEWINTKRDIWNTKRKKL
jgi:hypothetical protein